MLLCVAQGFGGYAVELDVAASEVEVGLDQVQQHAGAAGAFQSRRQELHVHVVAVVAHGVDGLRGGLDQRRTAVDIGARHGGNACIGQCHTLLATVGERAGHGGEVVVVGQGEGVHVGFVAEVVRAVRAVDALHVAEEAAGELVHILDVVAVLGCSEAQLLNVFVAFEVGGQRLLQLFPCQLLGVVDQVLDGIQRVGRVDAGRGDAQGL